MFILKLLSELLSDISSKLPLSLALLFLSVWLIVEVRPQPLSSYLIIGSVLAINVRALSIWTKNASVFRANPRLMPSKKSARPWSKF